MLNAIFQNTQLLLFLKFGLLIIIALYVVFAFVIVNQVQRMNQIFNEVFSSQLLFVLSVAHLVAAISLFFATLVIL